MQTVSGKPALEKTALNNAVSHSAATDSIVTDSASTDSVVMRYEKVTISYNGVPAVRDVSFALHRGEILGIAGGSGSGKSTLLKAAMGLLGGSGKVEQGGIWYGGSGSEQKSLNLADLSAKERRAVNGVEIALVFQDAGSSFCPVRTVGDQLWEAVRAHENHRATTRPALFWTDNSLSRTNCASFRTDTFSPRTDRASFRTDRDSSRTDRALSRTDRAAFEADAAALFRSMGFQDPERILRSYPFELSGGMAQRVGIAAAMLSRPAVLLADEPTSALDVSVQRQVVEELLSIRRLYGVSIIVVTHNIGVIRAMADRMLVMRDGEVVEAGETARTLDQPQSAYTRALLAAVPRLRR